MMDKDKFPNASGSSLPPSGRYAMFSPLNSSHNMKPELPSLVSGNSSEQGHFAPANSSQFSHDISKMSDNPSKNLGHRRAHSEDDISFDSDLGVVVGFDGPSFSDDTEEDLLSMYLDMDKFNSTSATSSFQVGESSTNTSTDNVGLGLSEKPRIKHQHSQSMDGSTTIKQDMLMSGSEDPSPCDSKKATSAAKLAELALIDPKRAKRIWANRQSAARSKERKMRYIAELEKKVQTLQTETASLSVQLTLLQRDTNGLTAHNNELKLRLQTMEPQVHLQDALNEALKEKIQHLKVVIGQAIPNGVRPIMNFTAPYCSNQQYYSNNHAAHTLLTTQKLQQLQIESHKQQQFQQHQIHQFQQQQQQGNLMQPQEQQGGDFNLRGFVPSQKEFGPDGTSKD